VSISCVTLNRCESNPIHYLPVLLDTERGSNATIVLVDWLLLSSLFLQPLENLIAQVQREYDCQYEYEKGCIRA